MTETHTPIIPEEDHMQLDKSIENIGGDINSAERYIGLSEGLDMIRSEPAIDRSREFSGDMIV